MTALYIGPYRQDDQYGLLSRCYIDSLLSLSSKNQLITRPLLLSNYTGNTIDYGRYENKTVKDCEIVIQHAPLEYLNITKQTKYNICIPIFTNKIVSQSEIQTLRQFDSVYVETPIMKSILDPILDKPTTCIKPKINSNIVSNNNRFNFGIHNFFTKYYTIVDYNQNIDFIKQLIEQFVRLTKYDSTKKLILFVQNLDVNEAKNIETIIQQNYNQADIKDNLINIIIVNIDNNISTSIIAHLSGDIFLHIYDTPHNTIHYWIAKELNKPVIDRVHIPQHISHFRNQQYNDNGFIVSDLSNMLSIILEKDLSNILGTDQFYNNIPNLSDSLPC